MSEEAPPPAPVGEQIDKLYDNIILLLKAREGYTTIQEIHNEIKPYKTYQQTYYAVQGIISTGLLIKEKRRITYGYSYGWLPDWLQNGAFERWANEEEKDLDKIKAIKPDTIKDTVREHLLRLFIL